MITATNVGDHSHVATVKSQPFAQHAAARGFKNGCVHIRVSQHAARTARPTAIAGVNASSVDPNTVGSGHADPMAHLCQQVRNQPDGCCLAIISGDCNQRNATVIVRSKERVDDRFTNGLCRAIGGVEVHSQPWRRIDFNDPAALSLQRLRDGLTNHIDSANVESDHSGGLDCAFCERRVDLVGHVGGRSASTQVAVIAEHDTLSGCRDILECQPLLQEGCERGRIGRDLGQRRGMPIPASRV